MKCDCKRPYCLYCFEQYAGSVKDYVDGKDLYYEWLRIKSLNELEELIEFQHEYDDYDWEQEYLECLEMSAFESFMAALEEAIHLEQTYGHLWDEADALAEAEYMEDSTRIEGWDTYNL